MKVYEVELFKDANKYCEKGIKELIDEIKLWAEDSEIGDTITINVLDMDETEYDNLPDFAGP